MNPITIEYYLYERGGWNLIHTIKDIHERTIIPQVGMYLRIPGRDFEFKVLNICMNLEDDSLEVETAEIWEPRA